MNRLKNIALGLAITGVVAIAGENTLKVHAFKYETEVISYTVQPNDTAYALMNGDISLFEKENPNIDSSKIPLGQKVNLPVKIAIAEKGNGWNQLFRETGLTKEQVFAMNPEASIDKLLLGQKIYLSGSGKVKAGQTNTATKNTNTTNTATKKTNTTKNVTTTQSKNTQASKSKQAASNTEVIDNAVSSAVKLYCTKKNSAIGVGVYRLDGSPIYTYNPKQEISGGCTIKLPFATYALKKAEKNNISLWKHGMLYQSWHRNSGSGTIKYSKYGTWYSFYNLFEKMLTISDNTAYNMNAEFFGHGEDFQNYLDKIGGQNLYGCKYGIASVNQRKNEMLDTLNYINSGSQYSETLKNWITDSPYCYIAQGMTGNHSWMHKSGWCDSSDYLCASDFAVIDNQYIVVIMTQNCLDSSNTHKGVAAIQMISKSIETYVSKYGV